MEFRQLEIFLAVVETGSFSRAGERLFLSQPAVTAHINALEKELEQQLLLRGRQGVRLTEGGRRVYQYALTALRQREEITIDLLQGADAEKLRIAASSAPAQYLLPQLLTSFRRSHQQISVELIFCDSSEVGRKLHQQQADIGFSGSRSFDAECEHTPLAEDRLLVITPATAPYSDLPEGDYPLERLLSDPMIMRESGSGTRREFLNFLHQRRPGAELNIVAVMGDHLALKNAVAAGMGIAVISEQAAADYAARGFIRAFPLAGAARQLYILKRKKPALPPAAQLFYRFALQQAEQQDEP